MFAIAALEIAHEEAYEQRQLKLIKNNFLRQINNAVNDMTPQTFRNHYRMFPETAMILIERLRPFISKYTNGLSVEQKVLAVVRFLAEGSYQKGIAADRSHVMNQSSFSKILHEVIPAINLTDEFIVFPQNQIERQIIAAQ